MPSLFGSKKFRGFRSAVDGHASQASGQRVATPTASPAPDQEDTPNDHDASQQKAARDLWREAFASLSRSDRQMLRPADGYRTDGDETSQLAAVEKIRELTEFKYKEYCKRGWHTKKGEASMDTNVKIRAQEIMCAALRFGDIVQAGLKFDPSGYGTTVWGVVSGVLTLVENDKERADAVFNSAAVLARFLPKYAIIEHHYRDRQTQEQTALEDQIREVYSSILKYAACVKKQLNMSLAGRLLESFWTFDNQKIKILMDELEGNDKKVAEQCHLVAHQYRKIEFENLESRALGTLNSVEAAVQKILEAEKLRTLKWLSDSLITDKQQQLRSKVEKFNKDSGKWLLGSDEYTSWLKSPGSFLWLRGASGCGKSMLCSTVVNNLVELAAGNGNMIVAYWYFDNADPQTQNLQRLVRLVLRRISAKATPFPEPVRDLAEEHETAGSIPGSGALIKTLKDTVADLDEEVFLVLDAIDEYHTGDETLRQEFLDFLVELGDEKLSKLHILVTSVSEADIENALVGLQPPPVSFDVEKPVSVDVDAYLSTAIERHAKDKKWSPEIKARIEKVLKDDGRFRIVSLQLDDLRKCYDDKEVNASLESIPHSIEDAYLRKLKNVTPKDVRRLRYIFCWISVAARKLTTSELAAAPGVDLRNPEDLFNICPSSMIRLEQQRLSAEDQTSLPHELSPNSSSTETNVVTFDHPSVKRFLYSSKIQHSSDSQVSQFFVSDKTVHAEFARLMVDHLLAIEKPTIGPSIYATAPFLSYSARYWHKHMTDGGVFFEEDKTLQSRLLTLFGDPMSPAYLNWIRIWNPERETTDFELTRDTCPSPLYMAVFLRLRVVSQSLIDKGSYINGTGGLMPTTLQLASQREDIEMSQKLIDSGERINNVPGNEPTALAIAVDQGNIKLVKILLDAGARPDAAYSEGRSALQLASYRGSQEIVELLVAAGADVNQRSGSFGTALQAAAAAGHGGVVAFLLDSGAKPDAVGGVLGTAIQAAETGGHSDVVRQLITRGVAWDEEGDSVWHEDFDQWSSPSKMSTFAECHPLDDPSLGLQSQQMLAVALELLRNPVLRERKLLLVRNQRIVEKWEAAQAERVKLTGFMQKRGTAGIQNKHYVYKAFFWAVLMQSREEAVGPQGLDDGFDESSIYLDQEMDRFTVVVLQLESSQKTIEHGNSDELLAARYELVRCYTLAFKVATSALQLVQRMRNFALLLAGRHSRWHHMDEFDRQYERFESVMRIARLQQLSSADAAGEMQHELLKRTRKEVREGLQALDEDMQERLAGLEHRVLASIRDMMPGIIREEMRKVLAGQNEDKDA